jgi:hypothetical protein
MPGFVCNVMVSICNCAIEALIPIGSLAWTLPLSHARMQLNAPDHNLAWHSGVHSSLRLFFISKFIILYCNLLPRFLVAMDYFVTTLKTKVNRIVPEDGF